jgi:hypothetical protein
MERCSVTKLGHRITWQIPMVLLMALIGCSKGESDDSSGKTEQTPKPTVASATPEEAVHEFMMAFKDGDEAKAAELVSEKTRQEMERTEYRVSPPGSKEMKFTVGEIQYVPDSKDLARVACHINDKDPDGEDIQMDVVWFLRKEQPGWRIAGVAMKVFPDMPAVLYNFEDMDDMQRKAALVDKELLRRATETLTSGQESAQETGNENVAAPGTNVAELPNSSPGVRK